MIRLSAAVGPGRPNRKADVKAVQALLNRNIAKLHPFLPLVEDGVFDPAMQDMLMEYQRRILRQAHPDAVVEPKGGTWQALNTMPMFKPSASIHDPLSTDDFMAAAHQLHCEVAVIRAVAETETSRKPFDAQGQPTMLFERHKFHALTGGRFDLTNPDLSNPTPGGYGTGGSQFYRFQEAAKLDDKAAKMAASWGMFQIMGFNYKAAGYGSIDAFVLAMRKSPREHLKAFVRFIQHDSALLRALQQKDWGTFAARYNGPEYAKNNYDERMKAAYERLLQDEPAPAAASASTGAKPSARSGRTAPLHGHRA